MTELMLAYVGAMLIGFEFVRKFKVFRGVPVLIMALPFRKELNEMPFRDFFKRKKSETKGDIALSPFQIVYGVLFIIILIPVTFFFWILDILVGLLNVFDKMMNQLHRNMFDKYSAAYRQIIGGLIQTRYPGLKEKEAMQKVRETPIPTLPIIGVILLTISFLMQIN